MSQLLTISQASKYLNVSVPTLRRWEKEGKIKAMRNKSNQREYTKLMLDNAVRGLPAAWADGIDPGYAIGYCRAFSDSNAAQADLENQYDRIEQYFKETKRPHYKTRTETRAANTGVGNQLNFIIEQIANGECGEIVVTNEKYISDNPDCIDMLMCFCSKFNTKFTVLDKVDKNKANGELDNLDWF